METETTWIDAATLGVSASALGCHALAIVPALLGRLGTLGRSGIGSFTHLRAAAPFAHRLGSRQA